MDRTLTEKYNNLELDIVPTHPDWTDDDYDRAIAKHLEEDKQLKEWPEEWL